MEPLKNVALVFGLIFLFALLSMICGMVYQTVKDWREGGEIPDIRNSDEEYAKHLKVLRDATGGD